VPEIAPRTALRPSVLDRLLAGSDPNAGGVASVRELTESVRRDIEALLNTRRPSVQELGGEPSASPRSGTRSDPWEGRDELRRSVLSYGLPELSSFPRSDESRLRLADLIREAIETFEPRLVPASLRVEPVGPTDANGRLHFRIDGLLRIDPVSERVRFETLLEPGSGDVQVMAGA